MCPSRLASALLVLVYFYKVYSKIFDICLHWLLSRCPVRTVSRDPIFSSINLFCPSELLVIYRLNSLEVSLLSARLVALYRDILVPMFLVLLGEISDIIKMTALWSKRCTRKSCPCLRIFVTCKRKSLGMASLLSRWSYSDGRLSSFCEEREIDVEVIEEIFSTVLCLILINLPCLECHVVTLQSTVRSMIETWDKYY